LGFVPKIFGRLRKGQSHSSRTCGKTYTNIIAKEFQWTVWATPKDKDGKLDHHKALTGDDLKDFVDLKLFPLPQKV
jgi:type I restriction enzyme M protein